MRVVLDTNVIVAALRSKQGLSYQLLSRFVNLPIELCLSVALVLEYEAVLKRPGLISLTPGQIDTVLDYLCAHAYHAKISYLWRPYLKDPIDDLVLELAVTAGAKIISYNLKDFKGSERLGVRVFEPAELFRELIKKGWKP